MISYKDLLKINERVCTRNQQISVVINPNNLHSALGTQQWYDNKQERACALFRSLIIAHGFQDGNKRTALVVLVALCKPAISQRELAQIAIEVAKGNIKDVDVLKELIYGD